MKIGFNCSSFDLFHAGHVTMLKIEKDMCDYLKVALQVDPTIDRPGVKNKPVQSVYERYVQLQACRYVDEILVYETEADLLNLLKPTIGPSFIYVFTPNFIALSIFIFMIIINILINNYFSTHWTF